MFNLFSMNNHLQQLKVTLSALGDDENYLQYKYNCYSLKTLEYLFVQSFCHLKTFTLEDVQKFVSTYFNYYLFKSDLLKHVLMCVCEKLEAKHTFRLRHVDWEAYFKSDQLDLRRFKQMVKPKR